MQKKFFYLVLLFLVGCFAGYIYETIVYLYYDGYFVNPGVLYGPWIPIYGIGTLLLYYLKPLKKNPILLFLGCTIICGLVEYIIGYVGIHVFDLKLWSYDNEFLNLNGIICLKSVCTFGVGGLLFHYLIEPFLDKKYHKMNFKTIKIIGYIFITLFVIDIILSAIFRTPRTF